MQPHEIYGLNLNAQSMFLISQIDGMVSLADLFDLCGMPRAEAAREIYRLVRDGTITLR